MKTRVKLFIVFILAAISVQSIDAQAHYRRNFYGDFFGGMTLASIDMAGQNAYKKHKVGFMVGGNANFKFFHNLELQTGFQLVKKGSQTHEKRTFQSQANAGLIQTRDVKNTIDANYMQIPLNIGFEAPLTKKLYLNMHVGVFGAYGFKGDKKQKGFYINENETIPTSLDQGATRTFAAGSLKRWDYGIGGNIGLVYDIYILRLQYDHGLANVATDILTGIGQNKEWKTRNYSICLGFRF